ncbi:MAG TPA: 3-deoxy-7-phosphoheptulonate synthase [Desulfobacterales bacterium]|nr:3-deoxy-7-phosphoheptulonate synthase [Desulfobacterales bacterium]
METRTDDLRVKGYTRLISPREMKREIPVSPTAARTVVDGRAAIGRILNREDRRLLLVAGPCSIHDEKSALEYAGRLRALQERVHDTVYMVMRVYFEKPRTTVGWKGFINDPGLDDSCDINQGLRRARKLLQAINEMGLPAGTEMVEMVTPQYVADLVSWGAIGARTTESQAHRELASGLSMPIGFKNGTDGNLQAAVNAMVAARTPQTFLGVDQEGYACIVRTNGNPAGHIVLRGGKRPNYDPISITEARLGLIEHRLPEAIMVDCSHGNAWKKFQGQEMAWRSVVEQRIGGNEALVGLMLESHLFEGSQKFGGDPGRLRYGVSITDECISWETTERLVLWAADKLAGAA